ncbi:TetR/AcrR family transcriptional regulator (plasmid) [Azospirillum baldaniorum]|uniref:Transcriptional regulatory protein n=1 Tax=Azospirillum baldaniorum TaxID=1064539 RepID=A0A9P1NQY6_9PROT|nr:TetR/AcrR family transcriptional regulator [Azospirillum baldaniorum]CCD02346.1 transcriptional regulatory protein [Azospirillum baldaniorum]
MQAMVAMGRTAGKKTRVQRSEEVRDALFQAAAEVVGEYGYIDASITRITQRANLAQGTFYNYFSSRQEIFDELLPVLGAKMLAHIRQQASGARTFLEKEEQSFRAFFSFLKRMPYFLRILNEAEIFAPKAHRQHFHNVTGGYMRFLHSARKNGEIANLSDEALEPLVYMLIATRGYLALRYTDEEGVVNLPEEAVQMYLQLLSKGLLTKEPGAPS